MPKKGGLFRNPKKATGAFFHDPKKAVGNDLSKIFGGNNQAQANAAAQALAAEQAQAQALAAEQAQAQALAAEQAQAQADAAAQALAAEQAQAQADAAAQALAAEQAQAQALAAEQAQAQADAAAQAQTETLETTAEPIKEVNKETLISQVSSSNNNASVKSGELTSKDQACAKLIIQRLEKKEDPASIFDKVENKEAVLKFLLENSAKIKDYINEVKELTEAGMSKEDALSVIPQEFKELVSQFIENASSQTSYQNDNTDINVGIRHYDTQAEVPDALKCSGESGDTSGDHIQG
ncbi:hypothetical protein [Rickettsia endosymbiont of Halotydeus destructor]|uniref:hypothetical protein n=1 Tax=Rickettsia endosymbiont of Halotydeus destructor TaxID=2996754 RepID=UPI003BAF6184